MVRIPATYEVAGFEGSYLWDTKCRKSLWFTTPDGSAAMNAAVLRDRSRYPKVADASFALVKDKEYEKFTRFASATVENMQQEYEVTATFTGRLDRCKDFKIGKNGFGNGFGQMGQSEYQFILQSVSEVTATKAENSFFPTPTRSEIPDHIPEK